VPFRRPIMSRADLVEVAIRLARQDFDVVAYFMGPRTMTFGRRVPLTMPSTHRDHRAGYPIG